MITGVLIFLGISIGALALGYGLMVRLPAAGASPGLLRALSWLCRIALAATFLYAAWEKLLDPYAFASNTYAYRLVPPSVATVVGVALPAIEVIAALSLLTGIFWRGSALFLAGLLAFFIFAIFQAILRGIDISCGCFGKESHPVTYWLIAQDQLLFLAAVLPLWLDHRRRR